MHTAEASNSIPSSTGATAQLSGKNEAQRAPGLARDPSSEGIRVGYLGQAIDHCDNLAKLFGSAGEPLVLLSDSVSWGLYDAPPKGLAWKPAAAIWRKSARLLAQLRGTRRADYQKYLLDVIDRHGVNCVLAYWGTWVLGDVLTVKRLRPNVRVILNTLCHPTGLTVNKVRAQNWYFRKAAAALDGIIVSSDSMKSYVQREVLRGRDIPCLVWPPYYSEQFLPAERLAGCTTEPSLLFLGRMDWRRSQPSDNCGALIQRMLDAGVHVYHHYSPESDLPHANRHTFRYMGLREAVAYATQFDVSLIAYNLDACGRTDRFDVTVPDRLVASVAAGIPVAVPARGYAACKEYLREYGAVIEFTSPEDLGDQLRDRDAVERLKAVARANSPKYCGERHVRTLLGFIDVVSRRTDDSRAAP